MTRRNHARDIRAEARAIRDLLDHLDLTGEDAELAVASESGLPELADVIVTAIREAETMEEALKVRIASLRWRQAAAESRGDRLRLLLADALGTAGIASLRCTEATVSLSDAPPTAIITDEDAVPPEFIEERTVRRIMLAELGRALRDGRDIAGAELRNSRPRLTLRSK